MYNLSGRLYDKSKFSGEVINKGWEDHHSPPIEFLFEICQDIHEYLMEKPTNVVSVHCLAGKGRTGTVICCYLMYCAKFSSSEQAMTYYHKKRGAGVTQPSQVRYVQYFEKILFGTPLLFAPQVKEIQEIILHRIPQFNGDSCKPYVDIYAVKDHKKIFENKHNVKLVDKAPHVFKIDQRNTAFVGDVQFKICHSGTFKKKTMLRFAFNTAMCPENK